MSSWTTENKKRVDLVRDQYCAALHKMRPPVRKGIEETGFLVARKTVWRGTVELLDAVDLPRSAPEALSRDGGVVAGGRRWTWGNAQAAVSAK